MTTRLRVAEIGPGMFSTESYVRFTGIEGDHALFVDKSSVRDQDRTMEVEVV